MCDGLLVIGEEAKKQDNEAPKLAKESEEPTEKGCCNCCPDCPYCGCFTYPLAQCDLENSTEIQN